MISKIVMMLYKI